MNRTSRRSRFQSLQKFAVVVTSSTLASVAVAQPAPNEQSDEWRFSGSLRTRLENWDWFTTPGFDDNYSFAGTLLRAGATKQTSKFDTQIEFALPLLAGLPDNAVAPAPRGALGLGANYRVANGDQDASLFLKQAYVRFKGIGNAGSTLRLGRFEFADGLESLPKDATLGWLKRERIGHRLIGNFGFSHVGRSFDGAVYSFRSPSNNFTLFAARPTEGVFQLNSWGEVKDVSLAYGSWTKPSANSDARLFALYYRDVRKPGLSVKVDNRPAPVRAADDEKIGITTLGGHYLHKLETSAGTVDLLAWGALQRGAWGTQKQRSSALALEAGFQPKNVKWKPWLRAGYFRGSGDGNAADNQHETFFQVLPTPRIYARFPFYNMMNNEDLFVQAIVRPSPKLNVRADIHRLRLNDANDLWYGGGGAFQDNSFGYAGRPSGGASKLATVFDLGVNYALNKRTAVQVYVAHARGGGVVRNAYPAGDKANYAYVEVSRQF
jgi:hypothetical protein